MAEDDIDLQSYLTIPLDQQPEVLCNGQDETVISEISEITRGRSTTTVIPRSVRSVSSKASPSLYSATNRFKEDHSTNIPPIDPPRRVSRNKGRTEDSKQKRATKKHSRNSSNSKKVVNPSTTNQKKKSRNKRNMTPEIADDRTTVQSVNTLPPDHAYTPTVEPQIVRRFQQEAILSSYLSNSFRDIWKYQYGRENSEGLAGEQEYEPPLISPSHALQLSIIEPEADTSEENVPKRRKRRWSGTLSCLAVVIVISAVGAVLIWFFLFQKSGRESEQYKAQSQSGMTSTPTPQIPSRTPIPITPTLMPSKRRVSMENPVDLAPTSKDNGIGWMNQTSGKPSNHPWARAPSEASKTNSPASPIRIEPSSTKTPTISKGPITAFAGWTNTEVMAPATLCYLSGNGTILALSNATNLWVLSLVNDTTWVPHGTFKSPQTSPLSLQLSQDGSTLVVSRQHTFNLSYTVVAAYRWGGSDYISLGKWIAVSWEGNVAVGVSRDGNKVAIGDSTAIQLFDWYNDDYVLSDQINVSDTRNLTLAGNAKRLAVVDGRNGILVYQVSDNIFQNNSGWTEFKLDIKNVQMASISKDGSTVACIIPQDTNNQTSMVNRSVFLAFDITNSSSELIQLGPPIQTDSTKVIFSLAANGLTVALQSENELKIMSYQSVEWNIIGHFELSNGKSLSLSNYGGMIVLAGVFNETVLVLRSDNKTR